MSGLLLGGAVSFALARQQMTDARARRAEEFARDKARRSADRRFDACADVLTKTRSLRNAIRRGAGPGPALAPGEIDAMNLAAAAAHSASSLVFLVVEDGRTYDACRGVVRAMRDAQGLASALDPQSPGDLLAGLGHEMSRVLREFEVAARNELEIGGLALTDHDQDGQQAGDVARPQRAGHRLREGDSGAGHTRRRPGHPPHDRLRRTGGAAAALSPLLDRLA